MGRVHGSNAELVSWTPGRGSLSEASAVARVALAVNGVGLRASSVRIRAAMEMPPWKGHVHGQGPGYGLLAVGASTQSAGMVPRRATRQWSTTLHGLGLSRRTCH